MSAGSDPRPRLDDSAIRRLRPGRQAVDPWRHHGVLDEWERTPGGRQRCRTIFLSGAECPFTCVFCDLWRFTTERPTPPGAVPRQIELALGDGAPGIDTLKLYNASNFFERRAVPTGDLPAIASAAAPFERLVVECHPRLVDRRAADFAVLLDGTLELALGLETVHPQALAGLNKRMTLEDFDRACALALDNRIDVRAFVLLGAPFVPPTERFEWVARSVGHALAQGVGHVALIPLRSGNGAMERLAATGVFTPPPLADLETAFAAALERADGEAVVTLDLWDSERLQAPECCAGPRIERLRAMNDSGRIEPAISCAHCAESA